jgi:xylulose-5-phosphate/fructose-6-phosphate phosphoketolase
VVGDGEAETGPLATAWHSNKFLNPTSDGAVLPILHLNGYKIANPTILARISPEELECLFVGYGYKPYYVEGSDPKVAHRSMAETLDTVVAEIKRIQLDARTKGIKKRPAWPMIILKTPKGWTGPKEVDGKKTEGFWRSHQVPFGELDKNPDHLKLLEDWMKSYKPEELFDENGRLIPELADLAPKGDRGINSHLINQKTSDLKIKSSRGWTRISRKMRDGINSHLINQKLQALKLKAPEAGLESPAECGTGLTAT